MKNRLTIILILVLPYMAVSQNYTAIINAFSDSYAFEENEEYTNASEKMKTVYSEDSYEINLRLGWLQYKAKKYNESLRYYKKAMQLMPYATEAKLGYVLPASALGKWTVVEASYIEILANSPNNTVACYQLGLIYYNRKQYETALKYFQKVVDLYPFDYDGLIMYAWTNLQLGKLREAKVLFMKVLMLVPDDKSAKEGVDLIK